MAEGGVEEESGDMLGPAVAPIHQPSPAVNNAVKTEVSDDSTTSCFCNQPTLVWNFLELHATRSLHNEGPFHNLRKL